MSAEAVFRDPPTAQTCAKEHEPVLEFLRNMRLHEKMREKDTSLQQRDLQRLQHLADCQGLLYSIAELLQIQLPRRPSGSLGSIHQAPLFLWESVGSASATGAEDVSFGDWVQAADLSHTSVVHILWKAITKNPVAFRRAWAMSKYEDSFSNRIRSLVLTLTNYNISRAQAEHATVLLCPCASERITSQGLVLSVLELMEGGCSSTIASPNVLVSPKDMLLKCAQHACRHNLNAEALWDMMYSTSSGGGTGLDGIVQVVMKCMPQLSCQDAIRASALLLLQHSSHGYQMEKAHFVREVDAWIRAMKNVAVPSWSCLSGHEEEATSSSTPDTPFPLRSTRSDVIGSSERLLSPYRRPRLGLAAAEPKRLLSASWSPRRMGSGASRRRDSDLAATSSDLASQLKAFQAWMQGSIDAGISSPCHCFEVFQRCLTMAPKLLITTFHGLGGSSTELPAVQITSAFERLSLQLPTRTQTSHMKLFLDVQGDGRIRVDDMKSVLPALCFSTKHLGLGGETGLSGHDVVVKVALWCCYMNTAPTQLTSMVATDGLGILHRKQVIALVRIIAKGYGDYHYLAQLLASIRLLSPGGDGAIFAEHLCTTVRKILRKWERAGVSPSRACWRP